MTLLALLRSIAAGHFLQQLPCPNASHESAWNALRHHIMDADKAQITFRAAEGSYTLSVFEH